VHAVVPGGTACWLDDGNPRPVGSGTRLGDGNGDVAQLERTTANAKTLILHIAES
jgi:hypothetical protein